jgi:hypothetical protein
MSGEIIANSPDVLSSAAGLLHAGADTAEGLKADVPGGPDAGEFSAEVCAVLAHLVDAVGQSVIGLGAVGDAVGAAAEAYRDTDAAASEQLSNLWLN